MTVAAVGCSGRGREEPWRRRRCGCHVCRRTNPPRLHLSSVHDASLISNHDHGGGGGDGRLICSMCDSPLSADTPMAALRRKTMTSARILKTHDTPPTNTLFLPSFNQSSTL
eukprot:scaffold2198_cov103-Skeletonema_dohrnii-CCMP3373.AAC.1